MFLEPRALWLLLLLPLLALPEWWRARHRKRLLAGLPDRPGLRRLLREGGARQRWLPLLCELAALALAVLALARPSWGSEFVPRFSQGRQVFLAIDTSRSMWATDISPNRLQRAKLIARDFIHSQPGERIALISFAGSPKLEVPLTTDHQALLQRLERLDPRQSVEGGTDLASLLQIVHQQRQSEPTSPALLVLLSDGETHNRSLNSVAGDVPWEEMPVLALGIGTGEGSSVPDAEQGGQPLRDSEGAEVHSRLEPQVLTQLAQQSGGDYRSLDQASADTANLVRWLDQNLSELAAGNQPTRFHHVERNPLERFPWLLAPALLLLVCAHALRSPGRSNSGATSVTHSTTHAATAKSEAAIPASRAAETTRPLLALWLLIGLGALLLPQTLRAAEDRTEGGGEPASTPTPAHNATAPPPTRFLGLDEFTSESSQIGRQALAEEDYERACLAFAEQLLSERPEVQAIAHQDLARTLFQRGRSELPAQPDQPSDFLASRDDWEDALQHLDAALSLRPDPLAERNRQRLLAALDQLNHWQAAAAATPKPAPDRPDSGSQFSGLPSADPGEDRNGQFDPTLPSVSPSGELSALPSQSRNNSGSGASDPVNSGSSAQPDPNSSPAAETTTPTQSKLGSASQTSDSIPGPAPASAAARQLENARSLEELRTRLRSYADEAELETNRSLPASRPSALQDW